MFPDLIFLDHRWSRRCRSSVELSRMTSFHLALQISPFILSTVMTITDAMRAKAEHQKEEVQWDVGDLWAVSNIYNCNYWFLGVEEATEVTESFRGAAFCNEGENFSAEIKVHTESLKGSSAAFTHVTLAVWRWQMFVEAASCLFKAFLWSPSGSDRFLRPYDHTGVPGHSGIWAGPSNCSAPAG